MWATVFFYKDKSTRGLSILIFETTKMCTKKWKKKKRWPGPSLGQKWGDLPTLNLSPTYSLLQRGMILKRKQPISAATNWKLHSEKHTRFCIHRCCYCGLCSSILRWKIQLSVDAILLDSLPWFGYSVSEEYTPCGFRATWAGSGWTTTRQKNWRVGFGFLGRLYHPNGHRLIQPLIYQLYGLAKTTLIQMKMARPPYTNHKVAETTPSRMGVAEPTQSLWGSFGHPKMVF